MNKFNFVNKLKINSQETRQELRNVHEHLFYHTENSTRNPKLIVVLPETAILDNFEKMKNEESKKKKKENREN
jgi:apolipoprotein N-acyltransferase